MFWFMFGSEYRNWVIFKTHTRLVRAAYSNLEKLDRSAAVNIDNLVDNATSTENLEAYI